MTPPPGIDGTRPADEVLAELSDPGEAARWQADLALADAFIGRFGWCDGVRERHVGCAAGPVSVFLHRVTPLGGAPEWHWVVVGDGPPIVLDAADAPAPACALVAYCHGLERWAGTVRAGGPLDDTWPLLTADGLGLLEPTPEAADLIMERVAAIRDGALAEHLEEIGDRCPDDAGS